MVSSESRPLTEETVTLWKAEDALADEEVLRNGRSFCGM